MENILVINGIKYKKVEDENFKLYDLVKYNGYEWYIIKIDNDNVTLLMKNKLDNDTMKSLFDEEYLSDSYDAKFNLDASNNDWVDSIIRQALNEKFIDKFDKNELNITKTNYDENKYSDDYIRLLTIREAEKLPREIRGIDEYYWTLSPSYFYSSHSSAYVWLVMPSGGLYPWDDVTASFGVRPVINLRADYLRIFKINSLILNGNRKE